MDRLIEFLVADINLWSPALALICGTLAARGTPGFSNWCRTTLRWFVFWVLGIYGLHGFVFHFFFSEMTAKLIGWPNSPFQDEVAYANLVFGVIGLVGFLRPDREYLRACILGFLVWFGCDGLGHVWQLFAQDDTAPFNAGTILYTDLLLPVLGVVLFIGSGRAAREAAAPRPVAR